MSIGKGIAIFGVCAFGGASVYILQTPEAIGLTILGLCVVAIFG